MFSQKKWIENVEESDDEMEEKVYRKNDSGKVWLVGAGPGDAGLLTVKGQKVIEEADVIVYDHLAGNEILSEIDREKKFINVGKQAGHHPISQEEINQILVQEAEKGKKVVRLKGGDPFLFGRGGEELLELKKHGIPFEVVPGVTSSLAVPAYNGIPVTHRDYASSLHIVTGHKKKGGDQEINYRALAEAGGTLVFLMGVTCLASIMENLIGAGMDPGTPAAILQEGTTARQQKISATLETLAEEAEKAQIHPPAIIIVGEVCTLQEELSWHEKLPLAGMCVMLTRPKELICDMADRLRRLGAQVLEVPTIATVPMKDNKRFANCLDHMKKYDWIVFTSQVGVRIFFEELDKKKIDVRIFSGIRFAVIGEGTGRELSKHGIYADLIPEVYDGETLARLLSDQNIRKQRILIPRASKGNQKLVPILKEAGAEVDDISIYDTVFQNGEDPDLRKELERSRVDCVTFTSSSTVEGFVRMYEGIDFSGIRAVCIGRQTAETAEKYGMECYIAEKADIDSMIEQIERVKAR